jgi:hypothetical protein
LHPAYDGFATYAATMTGLADNNSSSSTNAHVVNNLIGGYWDVSNGGQLTWENFADCWTLCESTNKNTTWLLFQNWCKTMQLVEVLEEYLNNARGDLLCLFVVDLKAIETQKVGICLEEECFVMNKNSLVADACIDDKLEMWETPVLGLEPFCASVDNKNLFQSLK